MWYEKDVRFEGDSVGNFRRFVPSKTAANARSTSVRVRYSTLHVLSMAENGLTSSRQLSVNDYAKTSNGDEDSSLVKVQFSEMHITKNQPSHSSMQFVATQRGFSSYSTITIVIICCRPEHGDLKVVPSDLKLRWRSTIDVGVQIRRDPHQCIGRPRAEGGVVLLPNAVISDIAATRTRAKTSLTIISRYVG